MVTTGSSGLNPSVRTARSQGANIQDFSKPSERRPSSTPTRTRSDGSPCEAHETTGIQAATALSRRIRRSHTPRDLGAAFTLDDSNVVLALQIKPELGTISKISAEPDGRICSDRAASIEDIGNTARWYAEIEREPICAELARF